MARMYFDIVEGEDYYNETGAMVFTEKYLLKRGRCCQSGCKHCPYSFQKEYSNYQEVSMTRDQIKEMVLDLLGKADYDLAKSFMPETAEEPEYAEESLQKLVSLAEKHINKSKSK